MILKSVLLYIVIQHCRVLQRPPVVLSLTFPELLCYKKPNVIVRNNGPDHLESKISIILGKKI